MIKAILKSTVTFSVIDKVLENNIKLYIMQNIMEYENS